LAPAKENIVVKAVPFEPAHRLNVLLTDTDQPWALHLPRLLEPHGVRAIRVTGVEQAVEAIEREPIHAAVVEMDAGLGGSLGLADTAPRGLKLLRILQRLTPTPPTVVVRGRRFDRRLDDRLLTEALKLRAFSVLDQPVELEQMLEVLRRLLQRHYGGVWPA
jgi:DNA-binding NtrC family response regulator